MRSTLALALALLTLACGDGGSSIDASPDGGSSCRPVTCAEKGYACGATDDGCGATLSCGSCGGGLTCGAAHTCDAIPVDVDVKTVAVSGTITANGQIPAQSCASATDLRGEVFFVEESGYASFRLPIPCAAADQPFTFSGRVYPGSYRVQVLGSAASSLPPQTITVDVGLAIAADRAGLTWDVATRAVGGTITQNGQIPAQTCVPGVNRAQVLFQEQGGGLFSFPIPCADPAETYTYAGNVPPGVYDVKLLGENSALPQATHVVQRGLRIDRDRRDLDYDIVTHRVSGTVTLNGAVPVQDTPCRTRRANVGFGSPSDSVGIAVPCAPAGTPFTFSGEVFPGTYAIDIGFNVKTLPRPSFRAADTITVAGPLAGLNFDVRTVAVSGTVTVDGAVPAACSGARWGTLTFETQQPYYNVSVEVPCAAGGPFAFATVLYPGVYTVWAELNGGEPILVAAGLDATALLAGATLNASTAQHPVSGTVTLNGAIPGSSCTAPDDRADVVLDELTRGNGTTLAIPCAAPGAPFAFSGLVAPGTYRVTIHGRTSDLPSNGFILAQPLVVAGPVSGLAYDVTTRRVAGTITLEGATPTCTGRTPANVSFVDETTHITFALPAFCDATTGAVRYEGAVFPATYTVVVYGLASTLPPTGYVGASGLVIR